MVEFSSFAIKTFRKVYKTFFPAKNEVLQPTSLEEQIYFSVIFPNDICFDIGANDGGVSMLLSQLVGVNGVIVAFEPLWNNYQQMCQYIQNSSKLLAPIYTIPFGLAECKKETLIHVPNNDFGMASIASYDNWLKANPNAKIKSYRCYFATLNEFMELPRIKIPDFIKIDVEGAELFVLQGSTNIFDKGNHPLIFMELFAPWEKAFNYNPWDVFIFLKKYEYNFLFVCPDGIVQHIPTKNNPFPEEYINGYNIISYHKDKHKDRISRLEGLFLGGDTPILEMLPASYPNIIDEKQ